MSYEHLDDVDLAMMRHRDLNRCGQEQVYEQLTRANALAHLLAKADGPPLAREVKAALAAYIGVAGVDWECPYCKALIMDHKSLEEP